MIVMGPHSAKSAIPAKLDKPLPPPFVSEVDVHRALSNIQKNVNGGGRALNEQPIHDRLAIMVGAGSSFNPSELVEGDVFAVRKIAAARLNAAGREPDYLVMYGSKHQSIIPKAKAYLFASMVDSRLFKKAKDAILFHAKVDGIGYCQPGDPITAEITAFCLAFVMGYRRFHIHGYDCSGEGDNWIETCGEVYRTNYHHIIQLRKFLTIAHKYLDYGCEIKVFGKGLLQTTVEYSYRDPDEPLDQILYDFKTNPSSFDFWAWLLNATAYMKRKGHPGPLRIKLTGFKDDVREIDNMTPALRRQMIENVVRPTIKMLGAVEDDTIENSLRLFSHSYGPQVDAYRAGESIQKIWFPNIVKQERQLTITLREAEYDHPRNSMFEDWLEFAKRRKADGWDVVFVRDTAKADVPIEGFRTAPQASRDLFERAYLYQASACNLSSSNGPTSLLFFSDNPFLVFISLGDIKDYGPSMPSWWRSTAHIDPPHEQLPWFNDDQRIVWERDTLENLENAWQAWCEPRRMVA